MKEFQLLTSLREDLQKRHHLTVFGLLKKQLAEDTVQAWPDDKLTSLAESIYETLEGEAVIDWTSKGDTQREMRRLVKRELRLADCPTEKIEEVTTAIMDLARVRLAR